MKSRSNSAFFIIVRALILAALLAVFTFIMELFLLGLWSVWDSQLTNLQLWLVPCLVFVFVFIWSLSRSGLFHTFLVLVLVGSLVVGVYFQGNTLQNSIFSTLISTKIDLQRYKQIQDPDYENTYLLTSDPFPMYYVDDGNLDETISQETLDYLVRYVQNLPASLLKYPSAMYFMEDAAFTAQDESYEGSNVFGVSKSSNYSVDIRLLGADGRYSYSYMHSGQAVTLDNPLFYTETIVHEMVHLIDMKNGSGLLISQTSPYVDWYENNPDAFGDYGSTSSAEWFAEAGVYYFLYPETLQQMSADLYEALSRVLN